jgi:Arrestin (or S-antigen), C-terminal domain
LLFYAEVENESRWMMTGTKMQLIQFNTFHAQGKKKICSRVLYQQKRGQFQSSESWSRVPIQIPAVVPSTLLICNHINVNYRIVVSIF